MRQSAARVLGQEIVSTTERKAPPLGVAEALVHPNGTQSAIDRLTSAAYELVLEGDSYRRRQKPQLPGADVAATPGPTERLAHRGEES